MSDECTSVEAIAAIGYLTRCFGGFSIPDDESRAFMRLFARFPAERIRDAIDESVLRADRRPCPNELAQRLRATRPIFTRKEPEPPPDPREVARGIALCRAALANAMTARSERASEAR